MTQVKGGPFLDGNYRLAAVSSGSVDPLPSDPSLIVFNSDWGELLPTYTSHIGTATISKSSSWQTISFSSFGYVPFAFTAFKCASSAYSGATYDYYTPDIWYFPQTAMDTEYSGRAPVIEVFSDHLAVLYNPGDSFVAGVNFPNTITLAWCVVRSNLAASVGGSRAGVGNWMKWSGAGLVIAKPGKNISSTDPEDFLVNTTEDRIYTQPLLTDTLSSLPYDSGSATYKKVINHGLGYIPLTFVLVRDVSQNPGCYVTLDSSNLTFTGYGSFPSGGITPMTYAILRQRWV